MLDWASIRGKGEGRQKAAPPEIAPPKPEPRKSGIALALGGGAARGWAHIGVLRALKRYGIEADIVCGSSVGALVGGYVLRLAHARLPLEGWLNDLVTAVIGSIIVIIVARIVAK